MSRLVVSRYSVAEAELREALRKTALVRAALVRCARLQEALGKLEPVAGESWSETLARYEQLFGSDTTAFVEDYNRLYAELPGVERQLEADLTEAKAGRLRLELVSAALTASAATPAERGQLEAIAQSASGLFGDGYRDARSQVDRLVRRRLEEPLAGPAESRLSAEQVALARELLDGGAGANDAPATPAQWTPDAPPTSSDAGRVAKLSEQLAHLDPTLVAVDDLLARLRELPSRSPGERGLLVDSIALEVQERLELARRKRDIERTVEDGLAWLVPFLTPAADALRARLTSQADAADLATARAAAAEARAWAEAEGARLDGERIRSVLASELRELGYEVNLQGPSWQEGSRITIQKPSEPNYDVELSAAPGGAIQSKVRAYAHPGRSAGVSRRDVEVEQGWCDDLARLNKLLAERGLMAEIAHEEGPGTKEQKPLPARVQRDTDAATARQIERKA